MKTTHRPRVLITGITILAAAFATLAAAKPAQAPAPAVLTAMQDELDRSMAAMSKGDPADYFISYTVADRQYSEVSGSNGALLTSGETRARWLEVQTRVGTYQLDDTHKLADRQPSWTSPGTSATVDDDIPVLRREIWRETDRQYRAATQALIKVKTSCKRPKATRRIFRARIRILPSARASKLKWTASRGKNASVNTPPRSANRPKS
jgi:hypothetical protein